MHKTVNLFWYFPFLELVMNSSFATKYQMFCSNKVAWSLWCITFIFCISEISNVLIFQFCACKVHKICIIKSLHRWPQSGTHVLFNVQPKNSFRLVKIESLESIHVKLILHVKKLYRCTRFNRCCFFPGIILH